MATGQRHIMRYMGFDRRSADQLLQIGPCRTAQTFSGPANDHSGSRTHVIEAIEGPRRIHKGSPRVERDSNAQRLGNLLFCRPRLKCRLDMRGNATIATRRDSHRECNQLARLGIENGGLVEAAASDW